uniref:Uncharacterized protein n=1 Tax=Spongospora subterranea TaxID=70186 RepID=A0A0H5QXF8_9EUKA|eukprot:CRZ06630.1 hypothetical protein [Spongospora subterranea]
MKPNLRLHAPVLEDKSDDAVSDAIPLSLSLFNQIMVEQSKSMSEMIDRLFESHHPVLGLYSSKGSGRRADVRLRTCGRRSGERGKAEKSVRKPEEELRTEEDWMTNI